MKSGKRYCEGRGRRFTGGVYICETKPTVFEGYHMDKCLSDMMLPTRVGRKIDWLRLASFGGFGGDLGQEIETFGQVCVRREETGAQRSERKGLWGGVVKRTQFYASRCGEVTKTKPKTNPIWRSNPHPDPLPLDDKGEGIRVVQGEWQRNAPNGKALTSRRTSKGCPPNEQKPCNGNEQFA